ncbi:MAG: AsmA family protein [Candidatus Omnitrophica bacterium]|nr:AsmA family protein [Candidatus Omnitrophota bacterium]MCM8826583.1 AsmA family protein [Candidatus Omnitrophota bacterium]
MKKIFKILVILFLLIIVISVIGILIFIRTFDINRFKPQILAYFQESIGRPIDFSYIKLAISFRKGIQINIKDLKLNELPEFGKDNLLSIQDIYLGISIKDIIFKRQLRVLNIEIYNPHINIVRLRDGRINLQALYTSEKYEKDNDEKTSPSLYKKTSSSQFVPAFLINKLFVEKAHIRYVDYLLEPNISVEFKDIKLGIKNFSLNKPFSLELSLALFSKVPNINILGKGEIDIANFILLLKDVIINVDFSSISFEDIFDSLPQFRSFPLRQIISGKLHSSIEILSLGKQGLMDLKGEAVLLDGKLRLEGLTTPLDNFQAKFSIDDLNLIVHEISFFVNKGKILLSGDMENYLNKQKYKAKLIIESIDIGEVLEQKASPVRINGLIFSNLEINGQGLDAHNFISNLNAQGILEIKDGCLTDINILKMVLDKLKIIPNLSQIVEENLPENFKKKLKQKDTIFTEFRLNLEMIGKNLLMDTIDIGADSFLFKGKGKASLDTRYEIEGIFVIPQELALSMVKAVPQMNIILNKSQQIEFPLKVLGKGSSISFRPDVSLIGINVIKSRVGEELEKALKKVFDSEEENKSNNPPNGSFLDNQSLEDNQPARIIRNIIDKVLSP